MNNQNLSSATKSLIETSRRTVVGVIDAGQVNARKAFKGCDEVFKTGTDTLGCAQIVVTSKLRDELVSLEGQLSLLGTVLTQSIARHSVAATNGAANLASGAADKFDQVFDLRVMKALERMGLPAGDMVSALAGRVATVAAEIDRVIRELDVQPGTPAKKARTVVKKLKTASPRRTGKRTASAAH